MFRLWLLMGMFMFFFFSSRRRHTRWNCDWSSDVCSSDLALRIPRINHEVDAAIGGKLLGAQEGGKAIAGVGLDRNELHQMPEIEVGATVERHPQRARPRMTRFRVEFHGGPGQVLVTPAKTTAGELAFKPAVPNQRRLGRVALSWQARDAKGLSPVHAGFLHPAALDELGEKWESMSQGK